MSHFYVDSNTGVRTTGGGTTKQTGSMATLGAANIYANILLAIADGADSGDFIMCSDLHNHGYTANTVYSGPSAAIPLMIFSVDDSNIDQYKAGASEDNTGAGGNDDLDFTGFITVNGLSFTPSDNIEVSNDTRLIFDDCVMTLVGTGDNISAGADGSSIRIINSTINLNHNVAALRVSNGAVFELVGVKVASTVTPSTLFSSSGFSNGGGIVRATGCDFTGLSPSSSSLIGTAGIISDTVCVFIKGCQMNSVTTLVAVPVVGLNKKLLLLNSSSDSDASEYQYNLEVHGGVVEDETTIIRDESRPINGTKVSLKVTTDANASIGAPCTFDAISRFAELSNASTDTIRIYFASTTTLNNANVWAELIYPDGTNKNIPIYLSNRVADVLAAGIEHTDDSGGSTWKDGASDLVGHNEYYMDLDTSGDVGADSTPTILIHVAEPSITVYFDTVVDTVA